MIEFDNVTTTLGQRPVLQGLSFRVREGETLVLLGRSGAGKSVTLKHIVGLIPPDSGRVIVAGTDITGISRSELYRIRLQIGYVFQSGALINWLDLKENLSLPLYEHRGGVHTQEEVEERVRENLRRVGLDGEEDKMPEQLSGGMKKRAGIARALMLDPRILLYDEPTAGLDPIRARAITHLVSDMNRQLHVTNLIVTHDLDVAFKLADRIALLHEGRIVEQGAPARFQQSRNPIVAAFLAGIEAPVPATASEIGASSLEPRTSKE